MILYSSPSSPYVRKVLVLLRETGQLGDVTLAGANVSPVQPDETVSGKNPLGKIPALERPDGATLFDSRVICAYLDARAGGRLYPEGARKWEVLTLEATADGIVDAAILLTYERRLRVEDMRSQEWIAGQTDKVMRACAALNTRWMSHLEGPLDMGQIAVGCALGYVDFRHPHLDWRKGNDTLANWYARFGERPSMQDTRPPEG